MNTMEGTGTGLTRQMSLLGLIATGVCSMLGASINVVPIMIQRNVEGIGPYVLPAFMVVAIPAIFAAIAYAILASAMPRAGGSYIFASRGLNPYLGFVASFSQWFGLSIVIGVVSYLIIPFFRDIAAALGKHGIATLLDTGGMRVGLSLTLLWIFVGVNLLGLKTYERILIPLMFLMFVMGGIAIVAGFYYDHQDFARALFEKEGREIASTIAADFNPGVFFLAMPLLFASFIGFDSIAQAGGEARNPGRTLPLAIAAAIVVVGTYYFLFTAAIYHAVPWNFIAEEAMAKDLTAPGLLSYLIHPVLAVTIVAGAAVALINDLPAMLLAVSRLMFAWGSDGIFPKVVTRVHPRYHTPHVAVVLSGLLATIGIMGSHFAGDFFLGIDIMVTSMLVNFLLMCITVVAIRHKNPALAGQIKVITGRKNQLRIGWSGIVLLGALLVLHIAKDIQASVDAWYYHSTPVWLIVMGLGSLLYFVKYHQLKKARVDLKNLFGKLPEE